MIAKILILLSFSAISVNCFYFNVTPYLDLVKNDHHFLNYYSPFFNESLSVLQTFATSHQINPQCRSSLKRWIDGLENREHWALKFLEATGKSINGKLIGRNVNYGSFDFCTMFRASSEQKIDFDGKYCMISVQTKEFDIIKSLKQYVDYYKHLSERSKRQVDFSIGNAHGVCMPSTCKIEEMVSVANTMIKSRGLKIMAPRRCSTRSEPEPWSRLQKVSLAILLTFISLCVLSSFVDNKFLSNFSLKKNWNVIYNFDNSADDEKDFNRMLHGGKALMLLLSIATHSMLVLALYWSPSFAPIKEVEENLPEAFLVFFERFIPFAGQMFFLGGFFAYWSWHDIIKKGIYKFTYFNYFIARYIRIIFIVLPLLLIYFLLPHLGAGPLYSDITNFMAENCKYNGYKILTSTANIQDKAIDMCNLATWYLSADTQIYVFNYFLIYYLVVKPKIGLTIAFVQFIINSILIILYNKYWNLESFHNMMQTEVYNATASQDSYFPPMFHHNQYLIGILSAFVAKRKLKPKIFDYRIVRLSIVWSIAFTTYYVTFWYPHYLEQTNSKANIYMTIIYPVIDKLLFIFNTFWLVYSVRFGYSKIAGKFFSLPIWVPISRLAFPMSLAQFIYISYSFASRRNVYLPTFRTWFEEFLLNLLCTFLLSNFIFLFVEGPLVQIFNNLTGLKRSAAIKKADLNNNMNAEKKRT